MPAMMAYADADGKIFEHPDLELLGWDGECWRPVADDELIELPKGSDMFTLPARFAAGFDVAADAPVVFDEPGTTAVSAFLAPAYLRTLLPAYETLIDAPSLPLFSYSAVGIRDGVFVAPGLRVDSDIRQDPFRFDIPAIEAGVATFKSASPGNRVITHIEHCALVYHCRAAQNFFLSRFEAPMPAASTCNALCIGCISFQPKGGDDQHVAAHDRMAFIPTGEELAEVALGHIKRVGEDAVVSFGQGCEGEPLNEAEALLDTVRRIRAATDIGVVNLNSNASRPKVVAKLREAGLDSLRVSTNSARPDVYAAYYRPKGYGFAQVQESSLLMKEAGGYVMLNYFVFPGVTDTADELDALTAWISEVDIDMIQLRNLNIDPEVYLSAIEAVGGTGEAMGIVAWVHELRRRFPTLRFGYFNPPKRRFSEAVEELPEMPASLA